MKEKPVSGYSDLEDEDGFIDFDVVTEYATQGVKNPKTIANLMDIPYEIFEQYKEQVIKAIDRGLAFVAMQTTQQMMAAAARGDFQAQKYLLQNIDDSWTDKKEVVSTERIDPKTLPSLAQLFQAGLEAGKEASKQEEKAISNPPKQIDGEFEEC